MRGGERGDTRNIVANGRAANRFFVVERFAPEGSVDHEIDLALFHQVHNIRPAFVYFEYRIGLDACGFQRGSGSTRREQTKTQRRQLFSKCSELLFVTVIHAEKNGTLARQALPRRKLRLRKRLSVRCRNSHYFARGAHLGTEDGIDATKLVEVKYWRFHRIEFANSNFRHAVVPHDRQ